MKPPKYLFVVKEKKSGLAVRVYGVVHDAHGYPHFVIRRDNQWLTVSAKHYEPFIEPLG